MTSDNGSAAGISKTALAAILSDAFAPRDAVQIRASVERLLFDPDSRARRILVFEPAIRVGDGDTVEDLRHRLHG